MNTLWSCHKLHFTDHLHKITENEMISRHINLIVVIEGFRTRKKGKRTRLGEGFLIENNHSTWSEQRKKTASNRTTKSFALIYLFPFLAFSARSAETF